MTSSPAAALLRRDLGSREMNMQGGSDRRPNLAVDLAGTPAIEEPLRAALRPLSLATRSGSLLDKCE
jgi:hypothetical protein